MTNKLLFSALFFSVFLFSNCKKDETFLPEHTQSNTKVESGKAADSSAVTKPEQIADSSLVETEKVVDSLNQITISPIQSLSTAPAISATAYDITKSLPAGYVKDGSVDYTTYIQDAIKKYSELVFPAFPILINDKGLAVSSNRKIWFRTGGSLKLKPTSYSNYKMFDINNKTNITIVGAVLVGDRKEHIGTTGETGIGIKINNSSNIKLYSPQVSQTWGDGIYIGLGSKDILIEKAKISKAGRNGIAITSGINVTITDPYVEYADRIEPMAGIDIEPNGTTADLRNIKIINPVTYKNGTTGLQIGLSQFYYDQVNTRKTVDIEVTNHIDEGSVKYGAWLSTAGKGTAKDIAGNIVSGSIKITNPTWKNNDNALHARNLNESAIELTLTKPQVISSNGLALTTSALQALFSKNIGKCTKFVTY